VIVVGLIEPMPYNEKVTGALLASTASAE